MKIHYIQHVPFESPASILTWAGETGHDVSGIQVFRGERPPDPESFELLIVMGGPMSVLDEHIHPWLADEKRFIESVIRAGGKVLGICLGAQLCAEVLGAEIYKNEEPEIGWFPVSLTDEGRMSEIFSGLPGEFMAFHWHGETYTLPQNSSLMAASECCRNQAFEFEGRVIGLQFHLESILDSVRLLIEHASDDLVPGPYVQTASGILACQAFLPDCGRNMTLLLDSLTDGSVE